MSGAGGERRGGTKSYCNILIVMHISLVFLGVVQVVDHLVSNILFNMECVQYENSIKIT
jgi:hypothetical protein